MGTCAKIKQNIILDCDRPATGGNESTLYLFNREDIQSYTRSSEDPNIVTAITMVTGKKGFKYEGQKRSLRPKATGVAKEYSYKWKHEIDFLILDYSSAIKREIMSLSVGEVVAIIVNKSKLNDAAVEIYGTSIGLTMKDGAVRDLNDATTEGSFSIGLESAEGNEEPNVPASFAIYTGTAPDLVYDYDATIAALNALITA